MNIINAYSLGKLSLLSADLKLSKYVSSLLVNPISNQLYYNDYFQDNITIGF